MALSKTENMVFALAEDIAKANGCYIYDVEFVKEGGMYFLRVYADCDGGIDLDKCEVISRALSDKLDEADPISQNYYLEVSSPGIERKLKRQEHFDRYIGEKIDIGLYRPINGSKQLSGELIGYDGTNITAEVDGEKITLPQKETTYVKLHFDF